MKYQNASRRSLRIGGKWIKQGGSVEIKEPSQVESHMIETGDLKEIAETPKSKRSKSEADDDSLSGG